MAKISFHGKSNIEHNHGVEYAQMTLTSKVAEIYEMERGRKVALIFNEPQDADEFNRLKVEALTSARENGEGSLMFVTVRVSPEGMVMVNADARRKIEEPFSESRQMVASDDKKLEEKWAGFVETR